MRLIPLRRMRTVNWEAVDISPSRGNSSSTNNCLAKAFRQSFNLEDFMNLFSAKTCVPSLLGMVVFAVYLSTIVPVVYVGDSGELTAAAYSLGIPHASGFPLYCLLGKVFCMIPLGNIGFKINLMSAFFSALAVCVVYGIILRITCSVLSSAVAAAFFAFTPIFWFQAVSAEVYSLHTFFVAVLIRLLWWWDENREFQRLLVFIFVTGLSFGNHMQTVMLAPAVLYIVISGDRKVLLSARHLSFIFLCFLAALSIYLYLPIRTDAGAAIHWGDPNNMERFFAHFTTKSYRQSYVFGATPSEYLFRAREALTIVVTQYGILLVIALWGWVRLKSGRWKVFFAAVIFFDLFYSVFLNLVSFEITPFTLPTSIALVILFGIGLNDLLRWIGGQEKIGPRVGKVIGMAVSVLPVIGFISNFGLCDQGRNYTAYEHAVNTFRTADCGSTVFMDGDNNLFPVTYGRIVERMGECVTLYDRHNIVFKWSSKRQHFNFEGTRDQFESMVDKTIRAEEKSEGIYFLMFNPHSIAAPDGFRLSPSGILRKAVPDIDPVGVVDAGRVWEYYYEESFHDDFVRDYMSREVCSFFFFRKGESLWASGRIGEALQQLRLGSLIGYNDTSIHSEIGLFFTDRGLFDEARNELEKALVYHDDLSGVHNNWGYYYHRIGDCQKAILSFEKAIELSPRNYVYYNNLGMALHNAGKKEEARLNFCKSLAINDDQPKVKEFVEMHGLQ
jgi:tetratricopeptide (TPR) repeat protein